MIATAPALLLLQTVQQLNANRKQTESTSSYEQRQKVPMHSTSCCGNIISTQENLYCNIIPLPENLYCNII